MSLSYDDLLIIPGVGPIMAEAYCNYFKNSINRAKVISLLEVLALEKPKIVKEKDVLIEKIFVITGSLEHFANRDDLRTYIEERGGMVTGSVSAKTDFLINNDFASGSSKNQKAKALGVKIISENQFLEMVSS